MFRSGKMKYIQIALLQRDFQRAIDYLGGFGWVEIHKMNNEKNDKFNKMDDTIRNIEDNINFILDFLNLDYNNDNGELTDILDIDIFFSELTEKIKPNKDKLDELQKRKKEFSDGLTELEKYQNLTITKKELESFEHIHFVIGTISPEDLTLLSEKLGNRITYFSLDKDLYMIFTTKKGRWSLDSEIKKISFKEKLIPGDENKLPKDAVDIYKKELDKILKDIEEIENIKNEYIKLYSNLIEKYITSFNLQKIYLEVYSNLNHSESISIIDGWVLNKKLKDLISGLNKLFGDTYSIVTYSPDELPDVKSGAVKVPVFMENSRFVKPFEKLIFNYGTPDYGVIDPTIFVAISFLLFFGLMYGDIGQGLVIFLVGVALQFTKKNKDAGFIICAVGISAMIFGYLYGSIFCFEHHHLEHIFTPINKTLFGIDRAYIIDLSPANSLNIFYATVGFGLLTNLTGIFISILNSIIKKTLIKDMFSHTGVAGFVMLLSVACIAGSFFVFGRAPHIIFVISLIVSLILIFLKEPLSHLATGHRPIFHEGFGMWVFLAIVELFEVLLSTISNNLSFIRVGAFAFAHAILSFTTIKLAEIAGGSVTSVAGIIVIIVGNLVIIVLEGMIVGIQTIRLEYYEFFSKFFREKGKTFIPFKIDKCKANN